MKLFDGSDSEEDVSEIKIDEEYARRFEHNNKREDLQRYEELQKKGLVPRRLPKRDGEGDEDDDSEGSSSSEDEEVVAVSKKKDLKFFENLLKIRKKDPALKSKDTKLFDSDSDSDKEDNVKEKKKKTKPVYLKDVVAKQLIEDGPDFEEKDDINILRKPTYNDEQEELRKAFLDAVKEEDDEDFLTVKKKDEEVPNESSDEELQKKVEEYFDEEDEDANFLKEFFLKKMWVDNKRKEVDEDDLEIVSEDDKEIEKQEEYEYRFQENVGDQVLGHAREVEGAVRKTVKARKEQRKRKEERIELARLEREEELRHLKNLKKKEMNEKIQKIMKTAGIDGDEVVPLNAKELEEEFDPEEYDQMMRKAFGENYYENEDVEGVEKPDFDAEDELLGLPKDWDDINTGDGFLAARERSLKHKAEIGSDIEEGEEEEDEEEEEKEEKEEVSEEVNRERRRKSAILGKAYEEMMDEYHKLDCESTIGDLKTRFRYGKTKANRYGLSSAEINVLDDKELNQYVSMKKIAPYVDREWKVPNSTRHEMKKKAGEKLRLGITDEHKPEKKKRKRDIDVNKPSSSNVVVEKVENGKDIVGEASGQPSNLSRSARRRQKQADLKLSQSRLAAYGKIAPKPKKKAKH